MATLIEVRLELLEVVPKVWRSLLIQDDISLKDMAAVLIGAMGWSGGHVFAYEVDGQRYEMLFDNPMDNEEASDINGVIARDLFKPGVDAAFNYDFGDDWWFNIEVVDQRRVVKGDKPPRCIAGERAAPPEDSGGPFGFPEILEAASDATHPDHDEIKEWLGDYDPERFDIKATDRNIRRMLKAYSQL